MTEFATRPDGRTSRIISPETAVSRRNLFRLSALGAAANYLAACSDGDERQPAPDRFSDVPSWEQDFSRMPDGPLDPQVWNIKLGPEGHDGAGQQIYTDKPENVGIRNGRLVITAFEQTMRGKPFTSARIDTLGKQSFGFGRLVVPAQMPAGRGVHPAIWLRRVPKPGEDPNKHYGEIDMVEFVGHRPDRVFTNLHTTKTRKNPGKEGIVTSRTKEGFIVPGVTERMVEYAVRRAADGIAFFIDGKQAGPLYTPEKGGKDAWPFDESEEYYLIVGMAIGDRWAGGLEGVDRSTAPWQLQVGSPKFYS